MDTLGDTKKPEDAGAAAAADPFDADFDAGWAAADESGDDPAAGRKSGDDPGTTKQDSPPSEENGAGGKGADTGQPPAAAGGEEQDAGGLDAAGGAGGGGTTPPGSTAAAPTTTPNKDTPPAETAAGDEGGQPPAKQGGDAPQEGSLDARFAKLERDTKAELGRVRAENRDLRQALEARQQGGDPPADSGQNGRAPAADRATALLEKLKDPLEKIREYDEDTATALETVTRELSAEISGTEQRVQQQAQQSEEGRIVAEQNRLFDETFPDGSYKELLQFDGQTNNLAHPEFRAFVDALPFNEARTFFETENPRDVIAVVKKYQTRNDPPGEAGGDPPSKPANDTPRRRAQAQAGAAVETGKSGTVDPPPSNEDSFDAGWDAEDTRIRRINKDQPENRRAFA